MGERTAEVTETKAASAGGISLFALRRNKEVLILGLGPEYWRKQGHPHLFWQTALNLLERIERRLEGKKVLYQRDRALLLLLASHLDGKEEG